MRNRIVIALALIAMLALGGIASAQAPIDPGDTPFDVDPSSGPPGTAITVAASAENGCDQDTVVVAMAGPTSAEDVEAIEVAVTTITSSGDGSWSGTLTVPSNAVAGSYEVVAACGDEDAGELAFLYALQSFEVTGIAPETGTAQPAVPVDAEPSFTG